MSVVSRPATHPQLPVPPVVASAWFRLIEKRSWYRLRWHERAWGRGAIRSRSLRDSRRNRFDAARFARFGGATTQKPQERRKYVNSNKVIFSGSASVLAHGPSLKNFGAWIGIGPDKIAPHDGRCANLAIRGAGSVHWRNRRHPNVTLLELHSFPIRLRTRLSRTGRTTSARDWNTPWGRRPNLIAVILGKPTDPAGTLQ